MVFFKWVWHKVIVLPRSWASRSTLALIRPLKWATVCLWTPSGSKNTSRQSWSIEKNVRFSTKSDVFFDCSTLTAGIFGTSGSSETYCTSFERSNQCLSGARSSRAWQYFYLVPRPFEKGHFTPYRGKGAYIFLHDCTAVHSPKKFYDFSFKAVFQYWISIFRCFSR